MTSWMTPFRRNLRLALLLFAALGVAGLLTFARDDAGASEPTAQLPKLVADKADSFEVQQYNVAGVGNRLLLRFNGYIENEGSGALDFRGSRVAPKVKSSTEKRVKEDEENHNETLEPSEQAEEASPPMTTFQRLFDPSAEETNMERAHKEEASAGELIYSAADGHDHWHLNRIARYSLVKGGTEVAPAQKVGFCLDDSEHINSHVGPSGAVYSDANGREFCDRYHPNATKLFEGISRGWRDKYDKGLYFQWVDISSVLPGEYQLREEVNPLGFVKEESGEKPASLAAATVPGYDALPQTVSVPAGKERPVTLTSSSFSPSSSVAYKIASGPSHGTLGAISSGGHVTYTPNPGYSGADSFTFSAQQEHSEYPHSPQVAKVSIEVGESTEGTPPPSSEALLAGDPTTSYSVGDQTRAGREEAFQFTAKMTGTVEELRFRTNSTSNAGVTGTVLAVFAENGGKPGEVLGRGTASGTPATNSWITVKGLSVPMVAGTTYWLVGLPLGSGVLHFNAASAANAGTNNVESEAGGLSNATAESAWEAVNQAPVGFQAIGTEAGISIEGAPASIPAGSSVQLTAHAIGGAQPKVTWAASAGTITTAGYYTAPPEAPAGGSVTVSAINEEGLTAKKRIAIASPSPPSVSITSAPSALTAGTGATVTAKAEHDSGAIKWSVAGGGSVTPEGAPGEKATLVAPSTPGTITVTARLADDEAVSESRQVTVTRVPANEGAPGLPPSGGVAGQTTEQAPIGLTRPRAMLIGRRLYISTYAHTAGRVRLSAYVARRLLGYCDSPTTAGRSFTCQLKLSRRQLHDRIKIVATLRLADGRLLSVVLPTQRVPRMTMVPAGTIHLAGHTASVYWCSPSALVDTLEASGE